MRRSGWERSCGSAWTSQTDLRTAPVRIERAARERSSPVRISLLRHYNRPKCITRAIWHKIIKFESAKELWSQVIEINDQKEWSALVDDSRTFGFPKPEWASPTQSVTKVSHGRDWQGTQPVSNSENRRFSILQIEPRVNWDCAATRSTRLIYFVAARRILDRLTDR